MMLCSLLKVNRSFGGTSADLQWTARRYSLKDSIFHNHRCENVRPHITTVTTVTTVDFSQQYGSLSFIIGHRAAS
jgi:hypothetical protein